jgi:Arm DNA-binding domain
MDPDQDQGRVHAVMTLRYWRDGRERAMGLGSARDVSLAEAREKRDAARKLLAADIDPIEHRDAERAAARAAELRRKTFGQCVEAGRRRGRDRGGVGGGCGEDIAVESPPCSMSALKALRMQLDTRTACPRTPGAVRAIRGRYVATRCRQPAIDPLDFDLDQSAR